MDTPERDTFTVNIALCRDNIPVWGVVSVPVTDEVYWAVKGVGSFYRRGEGEVERLTCSEFDWQSAGLRFAVSRSHMSKTCSQFIEGFKDPVCVRSGSSLKFLMIARGEIDIYPRFAPTSEVYYLL